MEGVKGIPNVVNNPMDFGKITLVYTILPRGKSSWSTPMDKVVVKLSKGRGSHYPPFHSVRTKFGTGPTHHSPFRSSLVLVGILI